MPSRDGDRSRCVVDEALRVMGVRRLRIADCSIFPSMPSAPTAATAMAVGRRAGELVTEEVWRHRAEEPKS